MRGIGGMVAAGLMAAAVAVPAKASTIEVLNLSNLGNVANMGTGTLGTVTLTQKSSSEVDVSVNLASGYRFVNTGSHTPFAFSLASAFSTAVVSILAPTSTTLFTPVKGSEPNPPFTSNGKTFTNGINMNSGNGAAGAHGGPLDFSVTKAGIVLADFVKNGNGYYFASDVVNSGGTTGAIGANTINVSPVPLPAAAVLFAPAVLGMGAVARRRAKKAAAAA